MESALIETPQHLTQADGDRRSGGRRGPGDPQSVLVVAHAWYGDVIGGSFRLASEFAEALAAEGCRVTYLCCAPEGDSPPLARETISGVDVRRYPALREVRGGWGRLRYHVRETEKLVRELLHDGAIDAVSGHSPLQALGAGKAVKDQPVYVNYTVHSPFDEELRENWGYCRTPRLADRLAVHAARWIDRRNLRLADRVQSDSRYTLDALAAKHGKWVRRKGVVAPGWVDVDRFRPVADRRATRAMLGAEWDTELPVFFTLRRLEARMGLDTLIAAAGLLRDEGHRFRVLIGGSGSLGDQLQRQISAESLEDTVSLLGRVDEADLPRAYAASDCFVLPTRALECFGLIVLEAFAAGTPVIASRVAAIPEIAGRQGEEWMFAPGNVHELADRMRRFLGGSLKGRIDLRETACAYSRRAVIRQWRDLLRPEGVASLS